MKCNFCGREVPKGTEECPYCHYRFEQEATILNPRERDEFEGVTIDESGYEEKRCLLTFLHSARTIRSKTLYQSAVGLCFPASDRPG